MTIQDVQKQEILKLEHSLRLATQFLSILSNTQALRDGFKSEFGSLNQESVQILSEISKGSFQVLSEIEDVLAQKLHTNQL